MNGGALIRGVSASANGNRSRPVSRDSDSLKGKKSGSGSGCHGDGNRGTVWASDGGFSRPLAPTAKFRSDGEISICAAAESPTVGKQAAKPVLQKNHSGQESGKRASDRAGTIKKESNKSAVTEAVSHTAKNLPTASVDSLRPTAGEASVARSASVVSNERRARTAATRSRVAAQSTSNKSASLEAEGNEVGGEDEEEDVNVRQKTFLRVRSRSLTLFQRIGDALGRRNSCRAKNITPPHILPRSDDKSSNRIAPQRHEDWVFFRGFSGKRREEVTNDSSSVSSIAPEVNPSDHRLLALTSISLAPALCRQTRTRARRRTELRRSLSLTDAYFIAQAVCEGDTILIQELYPDLPLSEPIYPIFDPKKTLLARKRRPTSQCPAKETEHVMFGKEFSPPSPGKVSASGGSEMSGNQKTSAGAAAPPSTSSSVAGAAGDGVAAPVTQVFQPRKFNGTWAAAAPITSEPNRSWRKQRGLSRQQPLTAPAAQQLGNAQPPPPSVIGTHSVGNGNAHRNNGDFAGGLIAHDGVTFSSSVMFVKQQDSHHHNVVVTNPGQASSLGELSKVFLHLNFLKCTTSHFKLHDLWYKPFGVRSSDLNEL